MISLPLRDPDDLRRHDDIVRRTLGVADADKFSAGVDQHGNLYKARSPLPHSMVSSDIVFKIWSTYFTTVSVGGSGTVALRHRAARC